MAKKYKFKLNGAGVRELLQSGEMRNILSAEASRKAQRAGSGYSSEVRVGQKRAYANIFPSTKEAAHDNYENNTLEKVIRS